MRSALVVLALLAAGCVQQQAAITDIYVAGHGSQIYQFSYDIRESVKVQSNDEDGIRGLVADSGSLTIIFNSTASGEEKSMFQRAVINTATKLPTYFSYEGRLLYMDVLYYGEDGYLYDKANERVELPAHAKILLLGPAAAAETSVTLDGNAITVQGTTERGFMLAGDKLSLIVMNITEESIEREILSRI